tara:strand:+ start:74 stop:292 length:219 start_codon:yes stop_codon:yes gene_type:complete
MTQLTEESFTSMPPNLGNHSFPEIVETECHDMKRLLVDIKMRNLLRNNVLEVAVLDDVIKRLTILSNLSEVS